MRHLRRRLAGDSSPAPIPEVDAGGPVTDRPASVPTTDEPAPPIALTWGDLSEIWTLLHLRPTAANTSARRLIDAEFVHAFGESLTLDDVMGMYDREENFEDIFKVGDRMVLTGMRFVGEINTKFGKAKKVLITVCTRESYPASVTYSAIGEGFAALAQNAAPTDFPHVAEYVRVRLASGNDVKRFAPIPDLVGKEGCSAFIKGDDGGAIAVEHAEPAAAADAGPAPTGRVDF